MNAIRTMSASRALGPAALALLLATLGAPAHAGQVTPLAGDFDPRPARYPRSPADLPGTDVALVGGPGWQSVPVAFSLGDGTFGVTNELIGDFAGWANVSGVSRLAGDFDGDGRTDIALVGGAGWGSVPVAFSRGDGTFLVTNEPAATFASYAATSGAAKLTGDLDLNGTTDLLLIAPGSPYARIVVAMSRGDGVFVQALAGQVYSPNPAATWQAGDFDGDGRVDLLERQCQAGYLYVLYADPDWSLRSAGGWVPRYYNPPFAGWACQPGARLLAGDFDGYGRTDLAILGAPDTDSVAVAFSWGYHGGFTVTTSYPGELASLALDPSTHLAVADFDGDGLSDVAFFGDALGPALPVAFSNGDGTFRITTEHSDDFPRWAIRPNVTRHVGDFNNDGKADVALTGGWGWSTLPVAFSNGDGTFRVTNEYVGDFAAWAAR